MREMGIVLYSMYSIRKRLFGYNIYWWHIFDGVSLRQFAILLIRNGRIEKNNNKVEEAREEDSSNKHM